MAKVLKVSEFLRFLSACRASETSGCGAYRGNWLIPVSAFLDANGRFLILFNLT